MRGGSTFWEIMILLATIALLLTLNLDKFTRGGASFKARSTEVEHELGRIRELQEGYRSAHGTYASSLDSLGFRTMPDAVFRYFIVHADSFSFEARAEALRDFDGDGTLEVWRIDHTGRITCERKD